ncbi:hypothetical protein ACFWP5_13445 [Streptomyces sp. NPDC058469]|uniref:hypothetical protein n=1 Tax=Streptomyces sp. NPDC058469 TaxID=3346514 RepID=UPI0036691449
MVTTVLWVALGAVLLSLLQAAVRALRVPSVCSWCTRASGHEVTGHTFDQCRGPRLAEQQRADIDAAHRRDLERRDRQLTEHADRRTAEQQRTAAKLRVEQIGNVTTRGREIHVTGWRFATYPYGAEAPGGGQQAYAYQGRPEQASGWTVEELHAMTHGGACSCDVARLAKTLR